MTLAWGFIALGFTQNEARASSFRFDRETLAFVNSTVFEYHEGRAQVRKAVADKDKPKPYTRRCFVMSRTAMQFHKFARFDPHSPPLDDKALAVRIREVTRKPPWHEELPDDQRINFAGYASLRTMSEERAAVLQENIGLGWPTYWRVGNMRMFFKHDEEYQEKTRANMEATLARGDLFVAYLSDYPHLNINHAVLVYARKPAPNRNGVDRYLVYDPNHPDAPRELKWSPAMRVFNYQKDEEFLGGFVRVYQVYGKPLQ